MLPKIIQHSYTRSTRDISTNFPNGLSDLYSSLTPRHHGKHSILPPLYTPSNNVSLPSKFKKVLHEKRILKDLEQIKAKKIRIAKGKTVEMLWNNFNIYIRKKEIAQSSIEEIMEKGYYIYKFRELENLVRKIQKAWKTHSFSKAKAALNLQKNLAARKIQKAWKKFWKNSVLPRLTRLKQTSAAIIIQKFYRGYRYRMKYSVLQGRIQIDENMKYFDKVRDKMYNESARIILRYWRKYKVMFT